MIGNIVDVSRLPISGPTGLWLEKLNPQTNTNDIELVIFPSALEHQAQIPKDLET